MQGISTNSLNSEQYWVLTDDYNDVLATTTLAVGENPRWRRPVTCPAIWTRQWGGGRVFVSTIGHHEPDFDIPEVRAVVERGMVWASRWGSALPNKSRSTSGVLGRGRKLLRCRKQETRSDGRLPRC
ncbi:type 1 glutamine amidotransferase [Nakamurella sp. UYEF19]